MSFWPQDHLGYELIHYFFIQGMTSIETELPFFVKYSLKQIIGVPNTFTLTGDKRKTWAYDSLTSAFSFTSSIGTVLMYLLSSVRLSSHIWRVLQLFSFFLHPVQFSFSNHVISNYKFLAQSSNCVNTKPWIHADWLA